MTDAIVWILGYPLSLLFFLFLGVSSLVYNKVKFKITEDEFQQVISKYRFPRNLYRKVYNNIELRNFLLPSNHSDSLLQANRCIWSFAIVLCFLALFTSIIEGNLVLRIFWIAIYVIAFPISWRLGHNLNQANS